MNVIMDLKKVWKGMEDKDQVKEYFEKHFQRLVSPRYLAGTLESACADHDRIETSEFMIRSDNDVFTFLAKSAGTHVHYTERPYADNRIFLMPKQWVIADGCMKFKTARGTGLCAISGDGKSQHLDNANSHVKGAVFEGHCRRSQHEAVRQLADGKWRFEKGGSAVAFKKSASENGRVCGAKMAVEEASAIFNKYKEEKDGAKMDVSENVNLFNPISDVGRLSMMPSLSPRSRTPTQSLLKSAASICTKSLKLLEWKRQQTQRANHTDTQYNSHITFFLMSVLALHCK